MIFVCHAKWKDYGPFWNSLSYKIQQSFRIAVTAYISLFIGWWQSMKIFLLSERDSLPFSCCYKPPSPRIPIPFSVSSILPSQIWILTFVVISPGCEYWVLCLYWNGKWQGTRNHDAAYPRRHNYVFWQILTEDLLCSRHYAEHWKYNIQ